VRGPKRPRLLFNDWPADDRSRWLKAFEKGDLFDGQGQAAHLAARTRDDLRHHYGCFLGFLAEHHAGLLIRPGSERVTTAIVQELVTLRRKSCRETSIASDLRKLRHVLLLLWPDADWASLLSIIKRIEWKASPLPSANSLVTSERLYKLGTDLMNAVTPADGSSSASIANAIQYRDGLLIAILSCLPLRRRTLAALRIGKHLVRSGACWSFDIPAEDMKSRCAHDFPMPIELSKYIEPYLNTYRRRILRAETHDGLWASNKGGRMDDGAIYDMVCRRTKQAFGFPVNLHRFRTAGSTLWAIRDPENVRGAKDLLTHSSPHTMEDHYIIGQSRIAGRTLAGIIGRRAPGDR
jgi:integrase/recombinase XerD